MKSTAGVRSVLGCLHYLNSNAMTLFVTQPWMVGCFFFPFLFQFFVGLGVEWLGIPHWGPVVLWYAFLVYIFSTPGGKKKETWEMSVEEELGELEEGGEREAVNKEFLKWIRFVLPWMFMWEGVSHKCFVMDLNGLELVAVSSILGTIKLGLTFHPLIMLYLGIYLLTVSCINRWEEGGGAGDCFVIYAASLGWMNGVKGVEWIEKQKRKRGRGVR